MFAINNKKIGLYSQNLKHYPIENSPQGIQKMMLSTLFKIPTLSARFGSTYTRLNHEYPYNSYVEILIPNTMVLGGGSLVGD